MATSPSTLAGNAICIQSCVPDGLKVPALISILAGLAGVSKDPTDLIKNSVCINSCVPLGLQMSLLVDLFAQIAGITPLPAPTPPTCTNLIPAGAHYNSIGHYNIAPLLADSTTYQISFGANDAKLNIIGGTPDTLDAKPGTFSFTTASSSSPVFLVGTANQLVTATICLVLSFTSITPNTIPANANNPAFVISGTGFLASGINAIKLSQGVVSGMWILPPTPPTSTLSIVSNSEIDLGAGNFFVPASTYTLSYSTDNGATWIDTGLTVTAS